MTAAVIALAISGSSASPSGVVSSGAAGAVTPSAVPGAAVGSPRVSAPERCSARRAVRFYARRIAEHQAKLGAPKPAIHRGSKCPRYLASVLQRRARAWRLRAERYLTLRDFDVRPGYSGWQRAVDEVQRAYPGTKAWLLSCSASEGGWGRWVLNSHGAGGWMQFLSGTFWRMWATARADVRSRGFRVPRSAASWQSPLGQALASAWALRNGLSYHWYGSGC